MRKRQDRKNRKTSHELLEKVGQLIEEQPAGGEEAPHKEEPPAPNRNKALMTYIAILFGVAFVLVLFSFLMQQKDSRQTISELNQNANNALSRAEQLQDDNRELTEECQTLQAQLEQSRTDFKTAEDKIQELEQKYAALQESYQSLEEQNGAKDRQVEAYELLLKAQRALDQEDTAGFQAAMKDLEPLASQLDAQGQTLYHELLPFVSEVQEETESNNP